MTDNEWNTFFHEAQKSRQDYNDFPDMPEEPDYGIDDGPDPGANAGMNGSGGGAGDGSNGSAASPESMTIDGKTITVNPTVEGVLEIPPNRNLLNTIRGVAGDKSTAVIGGGPGAGKTHYANYLLANLALGQSMPGGMVVPEWRPSLVVALEGYEGLPNRFHALNNALGLGENLNRIGRLKERVTLQRGAVGDLGEATIIVAANRHAERHGKPCGVIIIDTASRALNGDKENDNADVSLLINRGQRIADATNACVIFIHHPPKSDPDAKSLRGGGAFEGNVDCTMFVQKTENGHGIVTLGKQREDESDRPLLSFKIETAVACARDDGSPVMGAFISVDDEPPPNADASAKDDASTLNRKDINGLDAITKLHETSAFEVPSEEIGDGPDPNGEPGETYLVLARTDARQAVEAAVYSDTENDRTRTNNANNLLKRLSRAGKIKLTDEHVWLLKVNTCGERTKRARAQRAQRAQDAQNCAECAQDAGEEGACTSCTARTTTPLGVVVRCAVCATHERRRHEQCPER